MLIDQESNPDVKKDIITTGLCSLQQIMQPLTQKFKLHNIRFVLSYKKK